MLFCRILMLHVCQMQQHEQQSSDCKPGLLRQFVRILILLVSALTLSGPEGADSARQAKGQQGKVYIKPLQFLLSLGGV